MEAIVTTKKRKDWVHQRHNVKVDAMQLQTLMLKLGVMGPLAMSVVTTATAESSVPVNSNTRPFHLQTQLFVEEAK